MKKSYEAPDMEQWEMKCAVLQTVSGEGGESGVKPGEGGAPLSRRYHYDETPEEEKLEEEEDF